MIPATMPTSDEIPDSSGHIPLKYRPDIDGLRALAVLSVLFFHADLGFSGGFVGVDVFFVISGYLITGLILKDFDQSRFSIVAFWERRVRRIFPALGVVVVLSLIPAWILFSPDDFQALGQSIFAQTILCSNLYFWKYAGVLNYFDEHTAELLPLLHTWSLAVEEQFYLFFPFVLLAGKGLSRRFLVIIVGALGLASFVLSVYSSYHSAVANFYFLPMRAWELLIGALPAMVLLRPGTPRWLRELASWVGLAGILYAIFCYTRETRFPGATAFLPCAGTALIIWTNSYALNSVGKILAWRPFVFIGLISYSLYLWHWPVLVFAKYPSMGPLPVGERFLLVGLSGVLATLSWKYVETPFRKRELFASRIQILSFAGVSAALLLLAGFIMDKEQGLPWRLSAQALAFARGHDDRNYTKNLELKDALAGQFIPLGAKDRQAPLKFLVWGDSHAMRTLSQFDALGEEHGVRGWAATHSSTPPLIGYENEAVKSSLQGDSVPYNAAVLKFIVDNQIKTVVLADKWGAAGPEGSGALVHDRLVDTLHLLKASGCRVWIIRQVPQPGLDVPRVLSTAYILGNRDLAGPPFSLEPYQEDLRYEAEVFDGITAEDATVIDPSPLFLAPDGHLIVAENGKSLFSDSHHVSNVGARKLRPLFEPIFAQMEAKEPQTKK